MVEVRWVRWCWKSIR